MDSKLFEIIEDDYRVVVLAVRLIPSNIVEEDLLNSAGSRADSQQHNRVVLVPRLVGFAQSSPDLWGDRTYATAHKFIRDNWVSLNTGDVIDVGYILGERAEPRQRRIING